MSDAGPDPATASPPDLVAAFGELQAAVLSADDVVEFLDGLSTVAASLVPGTSCGITMDQFPLPATVVSSDHFARSLDEVQYGFDQGPCLQALETNSEVDVPDLVVERRWPRYREQALARGVRSSLSVPLNVGSQQPRALGALNLYSREPDAFGSELAGVVRAFARQAGIALTLIVRHVDQVVLERQLRDALATRAVIDQALGVLMGQQRIPSEAAWNLLRRESSVSNRKMREVAADLILSATGHPPAPPRPFAAPR